MSIIGPSVSGLVASVARLAGHAANVANAATKGPIPKTSANEPLPPPALDKDQAYQAVDTVQTSLGKGGGTVATYRPRIPSYVREYDPSSRHADKDGMVAAPNTDEIRDAVGGLQALSAYKANLAAVKAADDLMKTLLDMKT